MQNMQGAMGVMQSDPTENVEDTLGTGAEMMKAMMYGNAPKISGKLCWCRDGSTD